MIIYFTGIDGSGKSTIIELLNKDVLENIDIVKIRGNYEQKLLKPISNFFRKKKVTSSINYNNISAKDYERWKGFKGSILKNKLLNHILYTIQGIDYFFQINKLEKKYLVKNKNILIDRYILDFFVYQSVFYGDISNRWITRVLTKKLNKITLIIYLNVDSVLAFKRKNDIPSVGFLEERKKLYSNYSKNLENFFEVSNNGKIDETLFNIKKIINKHENNNNRN